jgi:hypothetical protein
MKDDTPADHEQVKKHVAASRRLVRRGERPERAFGRVFAAGHGGRDYIML